MYRQIFDAGLEIPAFKGILVFCGEKMQLLVLRLSKRNTFLEIGLDLLLGEQTTS